ncbi:CRISPR system precrRNA processing endoribonuclease RAMP protein Cas6 [Paenibacillus sp. FSL H8-0104]|uniref:CRISPR system precrRNA processing endoribonuclease RAMP protein Cas6 n=1 Tax=Paenibacillus sp. FSL H8-0104 TaxID=2954509 RepID=UPI0030FD9234
MNRQAPIFSLEYLPLLIRLECKETTRLPAFLGSTLHGVTGWALTRHSESYTYIFENRRLGGAIQDIVNPYIIEPPRPKPVYYKGDPLCFKLILIGDAVRYAKDILTSLDQAQIFGMGAERKAFELTDILHGDQYGQIWKQGQFNMNAAAPENMSAYALQEHASWCSVHMVTPVRIRRGGALVQHIDFPTIIRNITKRIQLLTERYGGQMNTDVAMKACELASQISPTSAGMYLNEMHRYSSRKKESVDWSGMLGSLTFEGELSPFIPWLNAARILHIGRNSTFGCGQIDVVYRSM